ncbi:MAG TPA: type I DNA topoisomerase [Halanaerobiales bacterium]|nr:type I DNA topoisomerase [Halanaerobiales bacterium]
MAKKNLVIVESPAKAKTIKKFLGKNYDVEASMGHVVDLPKSKMGINIEENFEPKYITIRGKGKVLKKLRKAKKKSENVYLATDPDREGEAISWHLSRALKLEESKNRIEFNEITKNAISNAMDNPREIDQDLVDAQQARRLLDRLVGYKLSPLLWKKVRKGLSAGRVQSVAVKIICQREEEIENFEPVEYWSITAVFNDGQENFEADLFKIEGEDFDLGSEKEVNKVLKDLEKNKYVIDNIKIKKRRRNPYPPFTTSTLQQRASSVLNFSAKKTMFIAQQLYEGIEIGSEGTAGLISYIRTDSTRLSNEAKGEAKNYIIDNFGDKYYQGKSYGKSGSNTQDAHEAIRPTSAFRSPDKIKKYLSKDQYALYNLIWNQFIGSQMKPAVYKTYAIDILNGKYNFRFTGSELIFPGFLRLFNGDNKDDYIPEVEEKDEIEASEIEPEQHFTNPPPRYTEASLVKTMEEEGIGRPSTYAPTLSKIVSRNYVDKKGKYFIPTDLGKTVNKLLNEYFPDVTDIEFTAQLEKRLDQIEEGKEEWQQILKDFYSDFKERLDEARENMEKVNMDIETDIKCEKCGRPMVIKHGRYGKFLACSGFPECKNTKPYLDKIGVDCPKCEDGEIVKRKSKKGKTFYGCSNYPDCDFVSWDKPTNKKCPKCGSMMVEKYSKKSGKYYKCTNKECKHTVKE